MGLRKMIVWDNPQDPNGGAVYGTSINNYRGLEVCRSYEGVDWEVVVGCSLESDAYQDTYGNGFVSGNANESGRGMIVYPDKDGEERLCAGTMRNNGGEIWRTRKYEE